jgi:hypothetical protein
MTTSVSLGYIQLQVLPVHPYEAIRMKIKAEYYCPIPPPTFADLDYQAWFHPLFYDILT